MRVSRRDALVLVGALILAAIALAALFLPEALAHSAEIPLFAIYSTTRMTLAFLLSLTFAVSYGYTAAVNKRASIIMLPILDVLQSVPILAFFPAVVIFFVAAFSGHPIGLEIAVIFLIFTSMAWNMAFGVYEAITAIPQDLLDAADAYGVSHWLRFRRLYLPAMIPKLVYNSILSWTVGWFYLVASEVFTAFNATYTRPGIGSFIAQAGQAGDSVAIAIGLGALVVVVILLDAFIWRPMSVWSERFRMEQTAEEAGVSRTPPPYVRLRWLPTFPKLRIAAQRAVMPAFHRWDQINQQADKFRLAHRRVMRIVWYVNLAMFTVILTIVVAAGLYGLGRLFLSPLPPEVSQIPSASLRSFSRLALAYVVSIAWTLPVAAWLGHSERASKFLTPVIEVVASVPATALFPVIIWFSVIVAAAWGFEAELAAFLVALFAMQWYLLFNVLAGVRSIPGDLRQAARVFGLRRWTYAKRLVLPAITPSILTGSITAWGAGWNALIVSEYIRFGNAVYQVQGLGSLLDVATIRSDNTLLIVTILALVVIVLVMNRLLWRPLIRRAAIRYRLEA